MNSLLELAKGQELELMKNLLYAKSLIVNEEKSEEILNKASQLLENVSEKYVKLRKIAESTTDFQKQVLEKKILAYKTKSEEIQKEIDLMKLDFLDARQTQGDRLDNTLASGLRSEKSGIELLGKLKGQGESIKNIANWSIRKDISESNSALVDLYVEKSKIKVLMVIVVVLQVFIFLLVLKIKLS